jgi:RecA-family ATPase
MTAELIHKQAEQLVILESEIEESTEEIAYLQSIESKYYQALSMLFIMKWQMGKQIPDEKYLKILDKLSFELDIQIKNNPLFTKYLQNELSRISE